jgi:hypothetical protein
LMRAAALFALAGASLITGASAQPDLQTPAVLAAVRAQLGRGIEPDARFAIAFGDLNDDHRPEAIVHLVDRGHCGSGGCTTFVLTHAANGWHSIARMTVSRLPIYRLPEHHNGWFDLAVYVSGGGVRPGLRAVRFAKGRYASNPTIGQAVGDLPIMASPLLPANSEFIGIDGN